MKKESIKWMLEYWQEVLLALFAFFIFFIGLPFFIYHIATIDPELKDTDLRNQLKNKLAKEMKEISLPPKTDIIEFENLSKSFSVLFSIRYRTELSESEFAGHFMKELEKKGWVFYRPKNPIDGIINDSDSSNDYNFCRGKQHAALNYQKEGGLFDFKNRGSYYLYFSVKSHLAINNSRPSECK